MRLHSMFAGLLDMLGWRCQRTLLKHPVGRYDYDGDMGGPLCTAETRQGYEAQAEDNRAEASHQAQDAEGAADAVHGGLTAEEVRGWTTSLRQRLPSAVPACCLAPWC